MSETETIEAVPASLTDVQLDDFARLLARFVTRGNIESLATHVLGPDAVRQVGNAVGGETRDFARALLQLLREAGRIPEVISRLEKDSHPNGRLLHSIYYILQGERLDTDEALQSLLNEYEPFLRVGAMEELMPRVRRTVCAVALGNPLYAIVGSGFLVAPDAVMTNYHVIKEFLKKDTQTGKIVADADGTELFFFFDYLSEPAPYVPPKETKKHESICVTAAAGRNWLLQARELLVNDGTADSPMHVSTEYDYAVIKLARRVGALPARLSGGARRGWLKLPETDLDLMVPEKRIMVFQHPQKSPQMYDIGDYVQLDPSHTRVWYRVNSAHGSSGGAAVDTEGQLFALHNAEVKVEVKGPNNERLRVNQGVRIDLIVKDLQKTVPEVVNVSDPVEDATMFWSLTDSLEEPSPIIGRREFREKLVEMRAAETERVLIVTGPPGSGLQYSIKLWDRTFGTQVPKVIFGPNDLQSLNPEDFLRVLLNELGIIVTADNQPPPQPSTENMSRWLRLDLPKWLRGYLSGDEQSSRVQYPAWVVVNAVPPSGTRLRWANNLQELFAALMGVHDEGQPREDVPQLRWLYLTPNPGGLPLTGVKHFVEDLSNYSMYKDDFFECVQQLERTVGEESEMEAVLARMLAEYIKLSNEMTPELQRLTLRKALSNGVIKLIRERRKTGGGIQ